jgi:hypothetical protein
VTRLEQFHQCKSNDETDSGPFEASQNGLTHPGQTLAQANGTLKQRASLPVTTAFAGATQVRSRKVAARYSNFILSKCVDWNPAACLRSPS